MGYTACQCTGWPLYHAAVPLTGQVFLRYVADPIMQMPWMTIPYTRFGLPWSPWVPFTASKHEFREIPRKPGLYRIHPTGKDFLMYIGETRRTVHERLNELRHTLKRTDLMPWNDPHTAAPSLWAWQDAKGFSFEGSATPLDIAITGACMIAALLLADLALVVAVSTFAMLIFYLIANIAAFKIPSEKRQYPAIIPVIGAVSCIGLIVFLNFNSWIIGIIGLTIGIVWFGIRKKRKNVTLS